MDPDDVTGLFDKHFVFQHLQKKGKNPKVLQNVQFFYFPILLSLERWKLEIADKSATFKLHVGRFINWMNHTAKVDCKSRIYETEDFLSKLRKNVLHMNRNTN